MKSKPMEISNHDYHDPEGKYGDYKSSTSLKDYLVSPKFANYKQEHPEEFQISLEASMKGSVYHDLLASLNIRGDYSLFDELYFVFEPPINPKTGQAYGISTQKYGTALEFAMVNNPGRECTSKKEVAQCKLMIHELLNNCGQTSLDVKKFLKFGEAECSHFVEYEGCKFKFRPDLQTRKKIIDWKSCEVDDLHDDTIAKTISKFKYDISAAMYQFFDYQQTGKWRSFYWVFQQKKAPYDAILVCADNWSFMPYINERGEQEVHQGCGANKFLELLDQHIYCIQTGDFSGAECFIAPDEFGHRIMNCEPPTYYRNRNTNFFN